jgi:hypothetical protein
LLLWRRVQLWRILLIVWRCQSKWF